jgi:hypothetical protein
LVGTSESSTRCRSRRFSKVGDDSRQDLQRAEVGDDAHMVADAANAGVVHHRYNYRSALSGSSAKLSTTSMSRIVGRSLSTSMGLAVKSDGVGI